jgi:hypothetical protein
MHTVHAVELSSMDFEPCALVVKAAAATAAPWLCIVAQANCVDEPHALYHHMQSIRTALEACLLPPCTVQLANNSL